MKLRQHRTVRCGVEASRQLESKRLLVKELILRGAGDWRGRRRAAPHSSFSDHAGVFGGAQVVLVTVIFRGEARPVSQPHHVEARIEQQAPPLGPGSEIPNLTFLWRAHHDCVAEQAPWAKRGACCSMRAST